MSGTFTLQGNLFDPSVSEGPASVTVADGRIAAVEPLPASGAGASAGPGASTGRRSIADHGLLRLPPDYLLVPGFVDAHTHLVGLGLEHLRPNCAGAASRAEALTRVADWLRANPGDDPVIGEGWDQSDWVDSRPPDRAELDAICPHRPLALRRVCGHVAVLNSRALEVLGGTHEGLDPGSGLALEDLPLSIGRLWPPDPAVMVEAVCFGQREAWRRGVTAIHEMGHPGTFRAFGQARAAGMLRLRVTHFFPGERIGAIGDAGLVAGFGDEWLRTGGAKFFLDGSLGGRSAAVREPYPAAPGVEPGGTGVLLWEDVALRDALQAAASLGFPPAMHAIGDRAIVQAISVVERMRADGWDFPSPGPRLEHAEMLDAGLIARAVEAGILFSMQPNFTARWQHAGGLYEQVLGPARASALNPYRAVAATDRLLFGSDTMPLDPLLGLRGACRHPVPGERLCFASALQRYTRAAAAAVPRPFGNGTVAPRAPADFVALRLPPGTPFPFPPGVGGSPPAEQLEVAATWVGGECVHADAAFREAVPAALRPGAAG
jgi:predicted amidohydrolase YtcJ